METGSTVENTYVRRNFKDNSHGGNLNSRVNREQSYLLKKSRGFGSVFHNGSKGSTSFSYQVQGLTISRKYFQ